MWPYVRTYWPCVYPGVVFRHASGPTGPWNSLWFFVPDQIPFPGSSHSHAAPQRKPNPASQKFHLTTTIPWTCKLFLKSDSFRRLSWVGLSVFQGSVGWKKFQNSTVHANQSYCKESAYTVSEEKDLQKLKSKSPHDEKETEEHVEAGRAHQSLRGRRAIEKPEAVTRRSEESQRRIILALTWISQTYTVPFFPWIV